MCVYSSLRVVVIRLRIFLHVTHRLHRQMPNGRAVKGPRKKNGFLILPYTLSPRATFRVCHGAGVRGVVLILFAPE